MDHGLYHPSPEPEKRDHGHTVRPDEVISFDGDFKGF